MLPRLRLWFDSVQERHARVGFVVAVVKKYSSDRGSELAALVTYYGFLSIFPLLLVTVTVLGIVLNGHASLRHDLLDSALADFPIIGAQLRRNIHGLDGSGLALAIGLLGSIWGSLGVAQAAQRAMAQIWDVPEKERPGFVKRILRSLELFAVIGAALVATTVGTGLATLGDRFGASMILGVVLALGISFGLFLFSFRILTPVRIPLRDFVPGAVVGAVGWTILQGAGSYLVGHQLRHAGELYGFFGVVLGLLWWLFLASQLTLLAAEVNVVRVQRRRPSGLGEVGEQQVDRAGNARDLVGHRLSVGAARGPATARGASSPRSR